MAHRPDDLEIVADEQIGEVVVALELVQQIDDLALDGAVEGGGRLVQNHDLRLEHDGTGNRHALALAAGEFVGIAVAGVRVEPGLGKCVDDRLFAFFGISQAWILSPSSTISPTDSRGLRLPNGSWNTICISRRSGRSAFQPRPWISRP